MGNSCPSCSRDVPDDARFCPHCAAALPRPESTDEPPIREKTSSGVGLRWAILAVCVIGLVIALLLPAIQTVGHRGPPPAARRIRQLGIGVHEYHWEHGVLPPGDGAPETRHSWMTAMLPFLDHEELHAHIALERTWDDPANAGRFRTEVEAFQYPDLPVLHDPRGYALTHYAGNVVVFGRKPRMSFADFTDGSANTLLIGEVAEGLRPWGDPDNLRDPGRGIIAGSTTFSNPSGYAEAYFVAADGAVHLLAADSDPRILEALATPDGGETVALPDLFSPNDSK